VNDTEARTMLRDLLRRIAPEIDLDEVDPHAPFQDVMDLDSMDFLNLITALHDTAGIDVPERDYPLLGTVDGFVSYVAGAART
jgi:acyl carrier protein